MEVTTTRRQALFATARIESARLGSGFIVSVDTNDDRRIHFLVTCRHVLHPEGDPKSIKTAVFWLHHAVDGQPDLGNPLLVTAPPEAWLLPTDEALDLALLPLATVLRDRLAAGEPIYYTTIPLSFVPSAEQWAALEVMEEIIFIGYPNALCDEETKLPLVRKGITATLPAIDWQGDRAFLVDASVFRGSSGSPVLILNEGWYFDGTGMHVGESRIMLLGVLSRTLPAGRGADRPATRPDTPVDLVTVKRMIEDGQLIDIGLVIKATVVKELIDSYLRAQDIVQ